MMQDFEEYRHDSYTKEFEQLMITRAESLDGYETDGDQIVSPGKFENEPIWAPYFSMIANDGEELSCMEDGVGEYASLVKVTDDERAMWPELDEKVQYILVTESDSGFVTLFEVKTEKQADALRDSYQPE